MKISRVMHKVIVVDKDITLKQAAKLMSKKKIGSLILIDKNCEIIGILTERDVLKNVDNLNKKISSVMVRKVVVIDINEEIEDAAKIMSRYKIKRLPVIENGKLSGIVTATDIIANTDGFETI